MSLYNALHGMNSLSPVLLKILGIDQAGSKFASGRFRDIHLNEDGTKITLLTRNGGGNRESYQEINDTLATHPEYIEDYDDDFDCTYAYFIFSIPKEAEAFCKSMATGEKNKTVGERFSETMKEMETMTKEQFEADPRFGPIAKKIFGAIEGDGGITTI